MQQEQDITVLGRDLVAFDENIKPTHDQMVAMWLHSVYNKSGSMRTYNDYRLTMIRFRDALAEYGLDLDSDEVHVAAVADKCSGSNWDLPTNHIAYESLQVRVRKLNGVLSPSTFNGRVSAISSFYVFARRRRWLPTDPTEMIQRRSIGEQDYAKPVPLNRVAQVLGSIDRSDVYGKRDFAILSVSFCTGRRRTEMVNLNFGDLTLTGEHEATLYFKRTKGNKTMKDQLPAGVVDAIVDYLHEVWGDDLSVVPADKPLWLRVCKQYYVQLSERLGAGGIAYIFQRYLGSGKTHAARHTIGTWMDEQNAPMATIQAQLGHSSRLTTETYINRDKAMNNPYTAMFADLVGVSATGEEKAVRKGTGVLDEMIATHPELTDYKIGKMLGVSPHTVKRHRELLSSKS